MQRAFVVVARTLALGYLVMGCGDAGHAVEDPPLHCTPAGYGVQAMSADVILLVTVGCGTTPSEPIQSIHGSIQSAVGAAPDGAIILVDAGVYDESVLITKSVSLVGESGGGAELHPPAGSSGIEVNVAGTVAITRLTIQGATSFGLSVEKAHATVRDLTVLDTASLKGNGGHGVQALSGAKLELTSATVTGSAGTGVLVQGAIAIIEGTFVKGCGGGGIAIIEGTFQPDDGGNAEIIEGTFTGTAQNTLRANEVVDNAIFGVGLFRVGASLQGNTIRNTSKPPTGSGGDGLVVVAPGVSSTSGVAVDLDSLNIIEDNERAGALFSGPVDEAAIIEGTFLTAEVHGILRNNAYGGLWAQGAISLLLGSGSSLEDNHLYGAAATSGARLTVESATITRTIASLWYPPGGETPPEDIGDGIVVTDGAALAITDSTIVDSARAGIVADAPSSATFSVKGTTISGGEYGIALQTLSQDRAWSLPEVGQGGLDISDTSTAAIQLDAGLVVQKSLCDTPDKLSCLPK